MHERLCFFLFSIFSPVQSKKRDRETGIGGGDLSRKIPASPHFHLVSTSPLSSCMDKSTYQSGEGLGHLEGMGRGFHHMKHLLDGNFHDEVFLVLDGRECSEAKFKARSSFSLCLVPTYLIYTSVRRRVKSCSASSRIMAAAILAPPWTEGSMGLA